MIKLSAAEDKIKIWLPLSDEYEIIVEDKHGHEEMAALLNVPEDGKYYNIYRLESMQDTEAEYDYKLLYHNTVEENKSFLKKWGWRWILIGISTGFLINLIN